MLTTRAHLVALLVVGAPALARAQAFPQDSAWLPLRCGDQPATDALRDQPGAVGARDIVGDAQAPAAYRSFDAQFLYLRMRLDETPAQGNGLQPFGWGYAFDLDDDVSDYEALVIADGQTTQVAVHANTTTSMSGSPGDPADSPPLATAPFGTRGRVVQAGSALGGNGDHYLDLAFAWSELALVQIGPLTPVRLYIGTSTLGDRLNDDLACHLGSSGAPTLGAPSSPREPAQGEATNGDGGVLGDGGVPIGQTRGVEGGPGCAYAARSPAGVSAGLALVAGALLLLALQGARRSRRQPSGVRRRGA
jgi:hypothetical protein